MEYRGGELIMKDSTLSIALGKTQAWAHSAIALCCQKPKEIGFFSALMLFAGVAIYKSTPAFISPVFELKISKNNAAIQTLSQVRDIGATKSLWVDKLMLRDGARLVHPKLGVIGFSDSFFIDIERDFTVKKSGYYTLLPGSDDGFSLDVDGKRLCSFETDRPYTVQPCRIELNEGVHTFKLSYFQGGGHAGLTLAYQADGEKKQYWFGENSRFIHFD